MIHVVVSLIVIVGRPDVFRISLVRVNVYHPPKYVRIKSPAGRFTCFFGRNRSAQAKFGRGTKICRLLARRSFAKVDVLVPARNAERNAHEGEYASA